LLFLRPLSALREIVRSFQVVCKDFAATSLPSCIRSDTHDTRKQDVMAKQTKVTIETESLLIVKGRTTKRAWCTACATDREVIALEDIGVISNLEPPALEEWLNSGNLHRLQTADGSTLICLNSLLAQVQMTKIP
jgi:hypothetical protein